MKTGFESTIFNLSSLETTRAWVQQTFKIEESDIKVTEVDVTKTTVSWNADPNRSHVLTFQTSPVRFDTRWIKTKPTLNDVLKCYGSPKFYRAAYIPTADGPQSLTLHLWYPDQGRVIALNNAPANKLTGQMLVANVIVVNSTNVADMWPLVYPGSQYPTGRSVLRVWPGDINQLVVGE